MVNEPPPQRDRELNRHRTVPIFVEYLLLSLQRLLRHVDQAILGLAVGKVGDGRNGLLRVFLRQGACLFDAVALQDEFTCLITYVSQPVHS